jgi:hypothetical protein
LSSLEAGEPHRLAVEQVVFLLSLLKLSALLLIHAQSAAVEQVLQVPLMELSA